MVTRPDSPLGYADELTTKDPLLRLAHRVLQVEHRALQGHLPRRGGRPTAEQIHQLRIAVRRIRVALRLFKALMPREAMELRAEFRWFGRALGDVRDLDVYAENLARGRDGAVDDRLPLIADLPAAREAALKHLEELLEAARFAALSTAFAKLADGEPSPGMVRRWKALRIADAVHDDVLKTVKRLLKLGRRIDAESAPEVLHRLRIRAKRLRYELEFYEDFYPSLRKLTRAAKKLQDTLGAYRDACLTADRLRGPAARRKTRRRAADPATEALVRAQLEQAAAARRRFASDWRRFEKAAARDWL
jgi:CHAD domain-containing protein